MSCPPFFMHNPDSFVLGYQFVTDNSRAIFRTIVYQNDFKISIRLLSDRIHTTHQIFSTL